MFSIIERLFSFDTNLFITHVLQLGFAYLLAIPIAYNRESRFKGAGLRTFPLVSVASCGFILLAYASSDPSGLARVMQGVVTGVGFVGGGAIIKSNFSVRGTSTAAAIWITGAIGMAVATGNVEVATLLSLFTYLTFRLAEPLKERMERIEEVRNEKGPRDEED